MFFIIECTQNQKDKREKKVIIFILFKDIQIVIFMVDFNRNRIEHIFYDNVGKIEEEASEGNYSVRNVKGR